ncbi:MAG: ATP-binding protein [Spirochaetales bacterium]
MNDKISLVRDAYEAWVLTFADKPVIKVLTGIRRSGKSSLLRLVADRLVRRGVDPQRLVFLNMESLSNAVYTDYRRLHSFVMERYRALGVPLYLFLDEVQEIPSWEKAINSFLSDGVADVYLTGSNSDLLSGELASRLSGRYVEFSIFPLVFSEYLVFRPPVGPTSEAFGEFLQTGGFPGLHRLDFSADSIRQYLSAVLDSVVLKDVVMRHQVRDVHLLQKLLAYVADNIGSIISARSIADFFKNERRNLGIETVYNYLAFLQSAFVFYKVPRYDLQGKRLLETFEKYYLADLGLRHALFGYRDNDIGRYLENVVYLELRKRGYQVWVGRWGDLEIDFVATKGEERLYVQVAYLLADDAIREREFRPLRQLTDNYPKYVLTLDPAPDGVVDGIFRQSVVKFLLE